MQAREFIATIFSSGASGEECEHHQDLIEFRLIGNGQTKQVWLDIREALDSWPQVVARLQSLNDKGFNIYYGVNPRIRPSGTAADLCPVARVLWADLDYRDAALLAKNTAPLKGFNLLPSITVDTGNGYHLYWLLKEGVTHAEAEAIMRQLARVLAGDNTYDSPRILRLPGTQNVKDPTNPKPCRIVRWNPERTYTQLDFEVLERCAAGEWPQGKKPPAAPRPAQAAPAAAKTPPVYGNGHGFMHYMAQAIAPYWKPGVRHKLALGLAGLLRRDEVPREVAEEILRKISHLTGDTELEDRQKAVGTTYTAATDKISTSTAIIEAIGEEEAKRFFKAYNSVIKHLPPPPVARPVLPDFNLYEAVPPGSIFDRYVIYASEKTDAPLQYHAAAIVTVVAAALGNRVYIPDFHGSRLFPNLYTMLVGPSSRFRKSTSINIVHHLAKGGGVPTYPNNATVEQLYVKMCPNECEWREEEIKTGPNKGQKRKIPIAWSGSPWGVIYHREFANYLNASAKSYMQGHRDFLTDLYDGIVDKDQSSRETKTQGRYYVTDPAISMLCAVTPASMKDFITKTDIGSGFLSRFFVVMHPSQHKNKFGWHRSKGNIDELMALTNSLTQLTQVQGEMDIAPDAERAWVDFDEWIHRRIEEIEGTPLAVLDSFLNRLSVMAIKLSMCYAWGQRLPAPLITMEDILPAIGFCQYSAQALSFFLDAVRPDEGNRELRYQNQVLEAARGITRRHGAGPIAHRTLLQNSNLTAEQFRQAVDSLIEAGRLVPAPTSPHSRAMAYLLNEKAGDP